MDKTRQDHVSPQTGQPEEAAMPYSPDDSNTAPTDSARKRREASIMAIDGVEGVGIGQDGIGNESILVFVRDSGVAKTVPRTIDGMTVTVKVTGVIRPLPK